MVQLSILATAAAAGLFAKGAAAHPGEHHNDLKIRNEIRQRDVYGNHIARSLAKCARSAQAQEVQARAMERRAAMAERLRRRAGMVGRGAPAKRDLSDLESWEKTDHNETGSYESPYSSSALFGSNVSCVVTPEEVVGPYYVLGEAMRSDVTDGESGVPVTLDMQFIDVSTCEPVSSSLLVDLWHANATGVYSGVSAAGQGGLDSTFLRGVQATDDDGVVQFDTVFPGHYQGRATHMHITTHRDATLLDNGTYSGGTVTHIGQLFFDESLRAAVEAVDPYAGNTQQITSNDEDSLAPNAASAEYDPFPRYLYLGDAVSDGLMMWISVGVDMSADYTSSAQAAAYYYADGGVDESGSSMGGGAGGSGGPGGSTNGTSGGAPNGTSGSFPSGGMPSGGAGASGASGAPTGSGAPAGGSAGSAAPTGSVPISNGSSGSVGGSASSASSAVVSMFTSSAGHATSGTSSSHVTTTTVAASSRAAMTSSSSSSPANSIGSLGPQSGSGRPQSSAAARGSSAGGASRPASSAVRGSTTAARISSHSSSHSSAHSSSHSASIPTSARRSSSSAGHGQQGQKTGPAHATGLTLSTLRTVPSGMPSGVMACMMVPQEN